MQTYEKLAELARDINTQANEEGSEDQHDPTRPERKPSKRAA